MAFDRKKYYRDYNKKNYETKIRPRLLTKGILTGERFGHHVGIGNGGGRAEIERRYRIRVTYGITVEDYDKIFDEQGGSCKICGKHQSQINRRLCIDHDHATGKVRGLLCNSCNKVLGHSFENITILNNCIKYLERSV